MTDQPKITLSIPSAGDVDARMADAINAVRELLQELGAPEGSYAISGSLRLHCDGCGASLSSPTAAEGIAEAAKRGWAHADDGTDYCPDCARKDRP